MYHLVFFEGRTNPLLDSRDHIIQIGIGRFLSAAGEHLDHKHRIYLSVVLLI